MNFRNIVAVQQKAEPAKKSVKQKPSKYFNSLEYELIANLVLQQYKKGANIRFDGLLSIPVEERIPALAEEYGNKRMHQLLVMLIRAFCFALPIPKTRKLTDTKISVCACDILLAAAEDQLSLEDIIVFFESAKEGRYGPIKSLLHHYQVMSMLQQYRQERHEAYMKIKEEKETELKKLGPVERICSEPKQIGELFKQATIFDMTKKMSG